MKITIQVSGKKASTCSNQPQVSPLLLFTFLSYPG